MLKLLSLSPVLLLLATAGCGEPTVPPEEAYAPEKLAGSVDTSLPKELQEKQRVIRKVLVTLQEAIDFDDLPGYHPDVRFTESLEGFLEGTINLARWDFNGRPTGDDVPLVVFLSEDTTGRNERRVERVYTVTGSPGRWTISRKR